MPKLKMLIALFAAMAVLCASPAFAEMHAAPAAAETPAVEEAEEKAPSRIERDAIYPDWQEAANQAQRWLKAGDLLMLGNQPHLAYAYYLRLAKVAPRGSPLKKVAKSRGRAALFRMKHCNAMPPKENMAMEAWDLLTW